MKQMIKNETLTFVIPYTKNRYFIDNLDSFSEVFKIIKKNTNPLVSYRFRYAHYEPIIFSCGKVGV